MHFSEDSVIFAAKAQPSEETPEVRNIRSVFSNNSLWKPIDETTCCDFSLNGKVFAWSLGQGFVGVLASGDENHVDFDTPFTGLTSCTKVIDCGENVTSLAFLPRIKGSAKCDHDALLATGLRRGPIKVWNAITGDVCNILFDHTSRVTSLTFSPMKLNLLVSSSQDKTLKVWDMGDNGNMCLTMRAHKQQINACAYSPTDPHMIASVGGGREVFLWNLTDKRRTGRPTQLVGHRNDVRSCAWSPDGALLATGSNDSSVIVWDVFSKTKVVTLGHMCPMPTSIYAGGANGHWVSCVAFSRDGTKLISTCEDDRARIWHLYDDRISVDEVPLSKVATKCAFSPNGKYAAIGQSDGSVKIMCDRDVKIPSLEHLSRMIARKDADQNKLQNMAETLPYLINQYLRYRR